MDWRRTSSFPKVSGNHPKVAKFFRGCLKQGIYFAPSQFESGFLSVAHAAADLETTARVMRESLAAL